MGAVTPEFLVDLETRMSVLTESEFNRLRENLWWNKIAKVRNSTGKKEILTWLLSTAQIRSRGQGGNISFDDLVATYHTIENEDFGAGFRISKQKLEDTDGGGMDLAAQWARDIGAKMAYHPQERVAHFLKNAHTGSVYTAYDGLDFFSASHLLDPNDAAIGTYSNYLTGAGTYQIDDAISTDIALANLSKVYAHIAGIKMPDGVTPRMLRPEFILCSPRLFPRAVQLTNAKYIAQAASSGGGSGDVEMLINSLGFAQPVQCDELDGFESNTTYFVACKPAAGSEMSGVVYQEREPFSISMYGEMTDAELSRRDELEWHCKGRNTVAGGHPYQLIKVRAT